MAGHTSSDMLSGVGAVQVEGGVIGCIDEFAIDKKLCIDWRFKWFHDGDLKVL